MSILARALRFMGTVWLWAAGSLIVFSHLVVLHLDGFWALVNLLNPWNIASALTLDLTVAPGLLLQMAANQLATIAPPPQNRSVIIPSMDGDRSYLGATAWTTVGDRRG
jgi:hypothetical protein